MDLSRYVELFLSEGREHVVQLNAALLELETAPDSAAAVAEAFRAVHSVKGMAAAMGYAVVTDTAHGLESLLDEVRRGDKHVTRSLVEHLLSEGDALARGIEAAVQIPSGGAATGTALVREEEGAPGGVPSRPPAAVPRTMHVRVRASRLDSLMNLVGELEIARGRLDRELGTGRTETVEAAFAHTSRLLTELKEEVITARMVPVGQAFERFPRLVRETARTLGKEVDFFLNGSEIELDRSMLDRIGDPVMHLLRNALDHGIESAAERIAAGKDARGRLTLSAQREFGYVLIRVEDDGGGINAEAVLKRALTLGIVPADTRHLTESDLLGVLSTPGFSTAAVVTNVSGRGVGLDVVDAAMRIVGGTLDLSTTRGQGTAITLRLPLTVAIVRALLARVAGETFAIPFTYVQETLELEPPDTVFDDGEWDEVHIGGEAVPVVLLRRCFGVPARFAARMKSVTVAARGRRAALVVDDFVGQQDIVVKSFDSPNGSTISFAGATVLSDGSPALIVDVNSLI
ncbi:MAG: chemotaxis protein CheA [Gemmatimonadaceae bacterium]